MARTFVNTEDLSDTPSAAPLVRLSFFLVALGLVVMMIGFGFRQDWATRLWIWDDQRMNFIFLASIAAAVAAPTLWVVISREYRAWAGVAVTGVVVGMLASVYLVSRIVRDLEPDALSSALFFLALLPVAVLSLRWSHTKPVQDPRPTPRFVRGWFVVFVAILVISGGALLSQIGNVFPWHLDPPVSTIFGCLFLGAAGYFVYALLHPTWVIAAGALWSFLAYDIVLAIPYLDMLRDDGGAGGVGGMYGYGSSSGGDDVNETSLVVYLLVLGVSALVALYAFLIHPDTRIFRSSRRNG